MPKTPKTKRKKPAAFSPPAIGGVPVDTVNEKVSIAMVRMAAQGSVPAARTVLDLIASERARANVIDSGIEWSDLDRRVYLIRQLEQCHDDITAARTAGSWQAVATLRRQALQLRGSLEDHDRQTGAHVTTLTDDQLVTGIIDATLTLPPTLRDQLIATLEGLSAGAIVPIKVSG